MYYFHSAHSLLIKCMFCFLTLCIYTVAIADAETSERLDDCSEFRIDSVLLDQDDLKKSATKLTTLASGKLFYRDSEGICAPTTDTYIVGTLYNAFPRIVAMLPGHTPKMELRQFRGNELLLIYYFAGGNQYILTFYQLERDTIAPFATPPLASNMRSIEVGDELIRVQNQRNFPDRKTVITTNTYRYINNTFKLMAKKEETYEYQDGAFVLIEMKEVPF